MNAMFAPIVNSMYGDLMSGEIPRSMFLTILNSRYGITASEPSDPGPNMAGLEYLCPKYPEYRVIVYRAFCGDKTDYLMSTKWTPWHVLVATESFNRIGRFLRKLHAPATVLHDFDVFYSRTTALADNLYTKLTTMPTITELIDTSRLRARKEIYCALFDLIESINQYMEILGYYLIRVGYCKEVSDSYPGTDPAAAREYLQIVLGYIRRMGGYYNIVDVGKNGNRDKDLNVDKGVAKDDHPGIRIDVVRFYDPLLMDGTNDAEIDLTRPEERWDME